MHYFSIVHINIISSISRSYKVAFTLKFQATNIYETVSPSIARSFSLRNLMKFPIFCSSPTVRKEVSGLYTKF